MTTTRIGSSENRSRTGPLETIEGVAALLERADTDGDGVPDRNLAAIYDAVFDAPPRRPPPSCIATAGSTARCGSRSRSSAAPTPPPSRGRCATLPRRWKRGAT
jgi:hypothetical protein